MARRYSSKYFGQRSEGLKINRTIKTRRIGLKAARISIYDKDNIVMLDNNGRYQKVSIMGEVRNANGLRTEYLNAYKVHINNGDE